MVITNTAAPGAPQFYITQIAIKTVPPRILTKLVMAPLGCNERLALETARVRLTTGEAFGSATELSHEKRQGACRSPKALCERLALLGPVAPIQPVPNFREKGAHFRAVAGFA